MSERPYGLSCCNSSTPPAAPAVVVFVFTLQQQPPPLKPRRMRPLPPAPELLAVASARVLSWSRQRVRDDTGLEKLLHEAALVSRACCLVFVLGAAAARGFPVDDNMW